MNNHEFPQAYFPRHGYTDLSSDYLEKNLSKYKKYLVTFIKNLPKGAHVLDAGCGSGKTIALLRIFRPDLIIYAIDISDVKSHLPADVSFLKISSEEAGQSFQENFFDAIICQHVIEHLLSPIPTIVGLKRILKPGGRLFLETPNWTRLFIPFSHLFFWNDYTHIRIFTPFSIRKLLTEHGFTLEKLVTPSSNDLFPWKGGNGGQAIKAPTERPAFKPTLWKRVFNRLVNPFLKDLLIVVSRNEK